LSEIKSGWYTHRKNKDTRSLGRVIVFLWIYLGSPSYAAQAICDVPVHGYHGFAGDGYALTSVELILLETTVWYCAGPDFGVNSTFYKKA